jgi:hypothetical protein
MLSAVVEFDGAGPGDFKPAEFMQRESFGPEALSGSVDVELNAGVHVLADFRGWLLAYGMGKGRSAKSVTVVA